VADDERRRTTECAHEKPSVLLARLNPNGSRFVFDGCPDCHKNMRGGEWVPLSTPGAESAPVVEDLRVMNPVCQVCGELGTEQHHWAPREKFGREAELWPTSWLCRGCHSHWHAVMEGRSIEVLPQEQRAETG